MKYIHVKVTASARKESLLEKDSEHFVISVKEKAENNLANKRVLELVSEKFSVSLNKVRIVNGHRSPSKLMVIE